MLRTNNKVKAVTSYFFLIPVLFLTASEVIPDFPKANEIPPTPGAQSSTWTATYMDTGNGNGVVHYKGIIRRHQNARICGGSGNNAVHGWTVQADFIIEAGKTGSFAENHRNITTPITVLGITQRETQRVGGKALTLFLRDIEKDIFDGVSRQGALAKRLLSPSLLINTAFIQVNNSLLGANAPVLRELGVIYSRIAALEILNSSGEVTRTWAQESQSLSIDVNSLTLP
jgi:hypothetical protein